MVAFLEKSTGSDGFHQVINFLTQSHIFYALTKKPDVVSPLSTILELDDQDGVTSIPNSEIFEQLALMGYHTDSDKLTFQKGAFSPQWRGMKVFNNMKRPTKGYSGQEVALFPSMLHVSAPSTSPSRITSSPSYSPEHSPSPTIFTSLNLHLDHITGRKLSDAEVQDKASNDTEPVIQDVTPTEVIQDQESSEKGSAEVSTAGAKQGYCSEEVPIAIVEKVWDFNQHIEPMEHGTEKMKSSEKSPEKMKSPEKIVEEDVDTQEEMKEVVKEPGTKRKKSIPRKSTRKRQKMEEDFY
ncbi:hypothetical protein Tco_0684916 [Tanacetum coccineum]